MSFEELNEPLKNRINDPEVKKLLDAYRERKRIKKLEKEYGEVFKGIEPNIGDVFWEIDIDELPSLISNLDIPGSREVNIMRSERSPEHNQIIDQMIKSDHNNMGNLNQLEIKDLMRQKQARSKASTLDRAIESLHNNIGSNFGIRRNRTGISRMEAYNASKEPFYYKIWFKVGLPSGITFIASLTELWRAFH